MGDPAGVGPELVLRVCSDSSVLSRCVPVVYGDAEVLALVSDRCNLPAVANILSLGQAPDCVESATVVDCRAIAAGQIKPGEIDARCGRAAYTYIATSIEAAMSGVVAGVATSPIHKEALHLAGVSHPGHTEIFTDLTGSTRSCMMLTSEEITVSFVTTHTGYNQVPGQLTQSRVEDVIELTSAAMQRMRGRPVKLLVCGLNPHAGEHGLFGDEEMGVLVPAIETAQLKGIEVAGPVSPDAAFLTDRRREVDAFVCMYHDQGHIPFKMLAFDKGVNVTLGLPIVRTSVDHGTAFDIAWQGKADPTSLSEAVLLAVKLSQGRTR